jgi:hypothetical protein
MLHNKRMQTERSTRCASETAADARRYLASTEKTPPLETVAKQMLKNLITRAVKDPK